MWIMSRQTVSILYTLVLLHWNVDGNGNGVGLVWWWHNEEYAAYSFVYELWNIMMLFFFILETYLHHVLRMSFISTITVIIIIICSCSFLCATILHCHCVRMSGGSCIRCFTNILSYGVKPHLCARKIISYNWNFNWILF